MKKTIYIFLMTSAVCMFFSCSPKKQARQPETAVPVEVYKPFVQDSFHVSVSGTLTARNSAQISTRIMSSVDDIYVRCGDQVKAGQVLVKLNDKDLLARKRQIQAQLSAAALAAKNAETDYQRFRNLHAKKSVSDKELENMELNKSLSEANLTTARQQLKEIDAMLAYTLIRSPFAGMVTRKNIDKGSMANPGMPLLTVEQSHDMEVSATIPENYIPYVSIGDSVEVDIKTLQCRLVGKISELSPSAALNGGQYAMKVKLSRHTGNELLAGMYATIRIPVKNGENLKSSIFIDKESLISREQLKGVYIVNDKGQAVMRWLQLGKTQGNRIEVLSGLAPDEQIVRKAKGNLYNGRKVSITR